MGRVLGRGRWKEVTMGRRRSDERRNHRDWDGMEEDEDIIDDDIVETVILLTSFTERCDISRSGSLSSSILPLFSLILRYCW